MKLKSQSSKLVLSYLWWVLEPIFHVAIFYFVFKYLLGRGEGSFLTFLMVGQIPYLWFQKSVVSASNSLKQNFGLIMTKPIPKYIFPSVNIQETTYKQLFVFIVLFGFLAVTGSLSGINWFDFLAVCLIQYVLMLGVGYVLSIAVSYIPDFSMVIQILMMGLMFASGVFWDINQLQNDALKEMIFVFNPLVPLLDAYRIVLMHKSDLDYTLLCSPILSGLFLIFISLCIFKYANIWLTKRLMT
ncbi:ABC transporter permease [Vibrio rotiferianus]|uniref:ABC transporter permease n=1 Tax=Vibrio rotiferianus TaxID=190895 RepID=UPI00391DD8F7